MPTTYGYDANTAKTCAELSNLVYELPYVILARIRQIVPNAVIGMRTLKRGNFRVMVVADQSAIYVVFRGTVPNSWRSVYANLKVLRKIWRFGKVHRGFLGLLIVAKPFYLSNLQAHGGTQKDIFFTGHSQGGAVAFLAAMDNVQRGASYQGINNYTFGQPRTGDKSFCRRAELHLGSRCIRITNRRDIFVGLPLVSQGYDHTRDFFNYNSNGKITRKLQSAGAGWHGYSFTAHRMVKYLGVARNTPKP